jgi:hypothetical protein
MVKIEEIEKGKLLIVEGIEDKVFFYKLLEYLQITTIQIFSIGGKGLIHNNLPYLALRPNFSQVLSIGIIRDADDNPSSAFASVCGALKKARLPVPEKPLIATRTEPKVNVMILPKPNSHGALEDLCLEAIKEDSAVPCVEGYFECLHKKGIIIPEGAISKAKVHTFLSSKKDPEKRLGEAAEAGYWPLENPAFDLVKQFLQSL